MFSKWSNYDEKHVLVLLLCLSKMVIVLNQPQQDPVSANQAREEYSSRLNDFNRYRNAYLKTYPNKTLPNAEDVTMIIRRLEEVERLEAIEAATKASE
jgi:hypothetical protein